MRERKHEILQDKPIMVHCAGGYRSAADQSILKQDFDVAVFDLSNAITSFSTVKH